MGTQKLSPSTKQPLEGPAKAEKSEKERKVRREKVRSAQFCKLIMSRKATLSTSNLLGEMETRKQERTNHLNDFENGAVNNFVMCGISAICISKSNNTPVIHSVSITRYNTNRLNLISGEWGLFLFSTNK